MGSQPGLLAVDTENEQPTIDWNAINDTWYLLQNHWFRWGRVLSHSMMSVNVDVKVMNTASSFPETQPSRRQVQDGSF